MPKTIKKSAICEKCKVRQNIKNVYYWNGFILDYHLGLSMLAVMSISLPLIYVVFYEVLAVLVH